MADSAELPTAAIPQVIERLTEKRTHLEKAVGQLGEAPSGLRDVFELCRGFERAYSNLVQDSPSASKIKEAFFTEKGLAGNVSTLQLEKVFELENVKKTCRLADGYQPHLVSPERGLRALASEALHMIEVPVKNCVNHVHHLLVQAAREASSMAGEHTDAAMSGKVPLICPEFKVVILPCVLKALEEWKVETEKVAYMITDMERSYITAGFFRYTMNKRFQKSRLDMQKIQLAEAVQKSNFSRSQAPLDGPANLESASMTDGLSRANSLGVGTMSLSSIADPSDYIAAHFDKKVNEDSSRASLPMDAWRWQRRFFIFSDSQKSLFYFKSPEDVPKPNGLRGQISVFECIVEDLDDKGNPRGVAGQDMLDVKKGEIASLLLRIRHKDPGKSAVKDHNSVVLRAESLSQKYEWLQRLGSAAMAGGASTPSSKPSLSGRTKKEAQLANNLNSIDANGNNDSDDGDDVSQLSTLANEDEIIDPLDMWGHSASSNDAFNETRLGEGAKIFRADSFRDNNGQLALAPIPVLANLATQPILGQPVQEKRSKFNVMQNLKLSKSTDFQQPATSPQDTWENRYVQLMQQFAQDMSHYIRMVCDTIVITVPKSIVHCLVRKSEKGLLNTTFAYVHKMTDAELQRMLKENPDAVTSRKMAREQLEDVRVAISDIQYMQEKLHRSDDKAEKISVPAKVIALASLPELLTREQRNTYHHLVSSQFIPELRTPIPMSHFSRPKKLPPAPAQDSEQVQKDLSRMSVSGRRSASEMKAVRTPRSAVPGATANGAQAVRRPPPPPPKA